MTDSVLRIIRTALEMARLAPSSHNCQPWRVRYKTERGGYRVTLGLERNKVINALPSLRREMYISLGGFSTILLNSLALQGARTDVTFLQKQSQGFPEEILALKVNESQGWRDNAALQSLQSLLSRRHTDRSPYQGRLTAENLSAIDGKVLKHSLDEHSKSSRLSWRFIVDDETLEVVCDLVKRYAARDFSHPEAWAETYRYIDFSGRSGCVEGDGFNIRQLLGPVGGIKRRFYQAIFSPLLMPATRRLGLPEKMADELSKLIHNSPSLCLLRVADSVDRSVNRSLNRKDGDLEKQYLLSGERLLNFWLGITQAGMAMHPVSVLLQHEDSRCALQRDLGERESLGFMARVGIPVTRQQFPEVRYRRSIATFASSV